MKRTVRVPAPLESGEVTQGRHAKDQTAHNEQGPTKLKGKDSDNMKRRALIIVILLAVSGCSILLPVVKFLAIPVAKHLLGGSDDSQDDTEDTDTDTDTDTEDEDEEDQG